MHIYLHSPQFALRHPNRTQVTIVQGTTAVEQIGAKHDHNAAFCDEALRFGIVMEEAMKNKTGYRAKYYRS